MIEKFVRLTVLAVALLFMSATCTGEGDSSDSEEADKVEMETMSPAPEDCVRRSKRYDQLSMHYHGYLASTGAKFDSSHDRGQPFVFQLGAGQVIKGWDEGLMDMCVNEKRRLKIPASKAYGETGAGELIPPNSPLIFEVELLSIEEGKAPPNVFKEIDEDGDLMLSHEEISGYLKKQAKKAGNIPEDMEQHNEIIAQIFSHEDKDKDGHISHEEFSGPKHDEF